VSLQARTVSRVNVTLCTLHSATNGHGFLSHAHGTPTYHLTEKLTPNPALSFVRVRVEMLPASRARLCYVRNRLIRVLGAITWLPAQGRSRHLQTSARRCPSCRGQSVLRHLPVHGSSATLGAIKPSEAAPYT